MKKELIVTYTLTCPDDDAPEQAKSVALEQSVELPRDAVRNEEVAKRVIPDIVSLRPLCKLPNGLTRHRLILAFSASLAGGDINQFFNLLFGNISLKKGLFVEDVLLPEALLGIFPGPNYGIEGIRNMCGQRSGPMLCSVLKPVGSPIEELCSMATQFARAGVLFIKDDHSLADQPDTPFPERVKAIQKALKRAGAGTVYLPNITAPHELIEERIAIAFNEGVKGFLVSPFLIGLDTFRSLRQRYPVLWMAHPSLSGTFFTDRSHGIRPGLLLGTFLRLLGADMVIFPHAGGRFPFTSQECLNIAEGMRSGYMGRYKPALPVPAGGISAANAGEVAAFYGDDVMPLIGGSIYLAEEGVEAATRRALDEISHPLPYKATRGAWKTPHADGKMHTPLPTGATREASDSGSIRHHIPLPPGVTRETGEGIWEGREKRPYKISGFGFKGITRTEIYVPEEAEAGFDVRYFEIEPWGFSSLEKHRHIHLVICVRGKGEVRINDTWHTLSPHSIALIPHDAPHQLRNTGAEMFGFYCIVDHVRDLPAEIAYEST